MPRSSLSLSRPSRDLVHGLFAALLLTACADLESPDEGSSAPADAEADGDAEALPDVPPLPTLTEDELAALQAERTIASLSVEEAGRIDIVDVGLPGAPNYSYVAVGGSLPVGVLNQLVHGEGATPAEVFLALAAEGEALPATLLADHRARAGADPSLPPAPRRLAYTSFRTIETVNLECYESGPLTFNEWLSDWDDRFEFINFQQPHRYTHRNTSVGSNQYAITNDLFGRVLSVCNSDGDDDIHVSFWSLTGSPGPHYPYTLLWSSSVDSYEGAHFYSQGSGPTYAMRVYQPQPDPDSYVAYGRCGGAQC